MTTITQLLQKKIQGHDAVLLKVMSVQGQNVVGQVELIYSRRFEGEVPYDNSALPFVGAPGSWGNTTLQENERALVFLKDLGEGRGYYQEPWHGHFSIVDIDGSPHAIAHWDLLNSQPWGPEYLFQSAFPLDPSAPSKTAMPLHLLERHLREELHEAKS